MRVSPAGRQPKDLAAGPYQPAISSFRLHLGAEGKSPKTIRTYIEAVQWFAAAHLRAQPDRTDWTDVTDDDVKIWMVFLLGCYSDSYANNQYPGAPAVLQVAGGRRGSPKPHSAAQATGSRGKGRASLHRG
jgi:hypothetical protein